jgi:cellulose synthase operon protein YhjQ
MGSQETDAEDRAAAEEIPEDVAVLYTWAHMEGAKYRDYSASRRELRARVRIEAAKLDDESDLDIGRMDEVALQLRDDVTIEVGELEEQESPAWLFSATAATHSRLEAGMSSGIQNYKAAGPTGDTLLDWQERVAARWYALKDVFDGAAPMIQTADDSDMRMPLLVVFSLSGGVGKTSMAATLGRALATQTERVVVVDTTGHGLLPIYFGSHEAEMDAVRTVQPRGNGVPEISLVSRNLDTANDERARLACADEILRDAQAHDRMVVDAGAGSRWLMARLADARPVVLVPIVPDLNSVMRLHATERLFGGLADGDGRPLLPYYILNKFDAALALHLDVREVFRRLLGERLLQVAIRRSASVSEAMAEGMTVLDYAPGALVAQDYLAAAAWVRSISPAWPKELREAEWGRR